MEKQRLITVKGIGTLKIPVDFIEVEFELRELNKDYEQGYSIFENSIYDLQKIITSLGFNKEELKTSEIDVKPDYDSIKKNGNYVQVFKGYIFDCELKLRFDLNSKKMAELLKAVSKSKAKPRIDIEFTVKDKEAVKKSLLAASAKDAREKADILCNAMGVKLGNLLTINYNWEEVSIYSPTRLSQHHELCCCEAAPIDFTPDDIDVTDDASFVWEITD